MQWYGQKPFDTMVGSKCVNNLFARGYFGPSTILRSAQTKRMHHRPWCVDDANALGWGTLTPHAMVWAKATQRHG